MIPRFLLALFVTLFGICAAANVAAIVSAGKQVSASGVVIFGASYAQGLKIDSIAGHNVINKGIGGNETSQMVARFDDDVIKLSPKAVLVWGFINDIHRSRPEKLPETIQKIKDNFVLLVGRTKQAGVIPILATEVTITSPSGFKEWLAGILGRILGKESYIDYVNKHVMETNNWLREFATSEKVMLFDFEKVLSDDDGSRKREYAIEDGSHLTKAAYDAIVSYIQGSSINNL